MKSPRLLISIFLFALAFGHAQNTVDVDSPEPFLDLLDDDYEIDVGSPTPATTAKDTSSSSDDEYDESRITSIFKKFTARDENGEVESRPGDEECSGLDGEKCTGT